MWLLKVDEQGDAELMTGLNDITDLFPPNDSVGVKWVFGMAAGEG